MLRILTHAQVLEEFKDKDFIDELTLDDGYEVEATDLFVVGTRAEVKAAVRFKSSVKFSVIVGDEVLVEISHEKDLDDEEAVDAVAGSDDDDYGEHGATLYNTKGLYVLQLFKR